MKKFINDKKDGKLIPKSGVYVGSDGIRLGDNFYVEPSGYIYALSGNIGGCSISSSGISGSGKGGVWSIDGAGNASFKDVTINGASVTGMMVAGKNGGFSGGGSSIGSGGASLARGSTKVGDQKIDDYVEGVINADYISSKLNELESVYVQRLSCTGSMTAKSFNAETLKKNNSDVATESYVTGLFDSLEARISKLENKT